MFFSKLKVSILVSNVYTWGGKICIHCTYWFSFNVLILMVQSKQNIINNNNNNETAVKIKFFSLHQTPPKMGYRGCSHIF